MLKIKRSDNIYLTLFGYILRYILYYLVLTVVICPYGISTAVTTAFAMVLVINTIRKKEKKNGLGFKEALGIKVIKTDLGTFISLLLLGVSLNFIFGGILNLLPSAVSEGYVSDYSIIFGGELYSTLFVIAVATPIMEEIFFRGIFQRKLMERLGIYKGLLAASLIFGIMHFNIIWSLYSAVMGFFLGCIFINYESVLPGAAVHIAFNAVSCVYVLLMRFEGLYAVLFGNRVYVVLSLAAGAALMFFLVQKTWMKRYFDKDFILGGKIACEVKIDDEM